MNVSKELDMSLANDMQKISSVEVTYNDDNFVAGFVHKVKFSPLEVILCKHEVPRGEDPNHYLDFENAVRIVLIYRGEDPKIFE